MAKIKLKVDDDKTIISCTIFTNGNPIVFNKYGKQMPQYQEHILKSASKIIKNSCSSTKFTLMEWASGISIPLTMKQVELMFCPQE